MSTPAGLGFENFLKKEVYIFQCTMDTRPEDLVITPFVTGDMKIEYRASSVVTAMIRGGILVLEEGNRMPERTWSSLAPLLDGRRYMDSAMQSLALHIKTADYIIWT